MRIQGGAEVQDLAVSREFTGVGLQLAADDVHERAFARPVLTDDRVDLAGTNVQTYIFESLRSREAFGDVADLKKQLLFASGLLHVGRLVCWVCVRAVQAGWFSRN